MGRERYPGREWTLSPALPLYGEGALSREYQDREYPLFAIHHSLFIIIY